MKFRAHETFCIRKGWLSKGMKHVFEKPELFLSKTENPMDVLGIGSNMVKSLRFWLQAVGLTEEKFVDKKRRQVLTSLGKLVFENDRYLEEIGTLQVLQYKLAINEELATSWYFFFNKFSMNEFSKDDFVLQIKNYIDMKGDVQIPAVRSLEEDFSCIVNTYLPRYKVSKQKPDAENNIDCPLSELGLIDIVSNKTYRKSFLNSNKVNPWIALAIIVNQCESGAKEIALNKILLDECNIGKVLNLDTVAVLDVLHEIEKIGEIKLVRTAGLDVVQIKETRDFEYCLKNYYKYLQG